MRQPARAQFIFQEAIEVAHQAGSLNRAGLAALTMIEEIDSLTPELESVAIEQAEEWLASSDSPDIKRRLKAARRKIVARQKRNSQQSVDMREVLFNKRYDLLDEVLKHERALCS